MRHRGFVAVSTAGSQKNKRGLTPALQVTVGTAQRCPFCHEHLQTGGDDDALVACAECLTVSHEECVGEGGGGCTTLGCAHSRPEAIERAAAGSSPPPAPAVAPTRSHTIPALVASLLVALGGFGLYVALKTPIAPPPPPHLIAAPSVSSFDAHVRGDVLVVRSRGQASWDLGSASAPRLGPLQAWVNGVSVPMTWLGATTGWTIDAELPLERVIGDRPGAHSIELVVSAGGEMASSQRVVRVDPDATPPVREVIIVTPPEIVVAQGPTLRLDTPVVRTNQTEVEISGFVESDGPIQLTVGDLTLQLQPGRFQTTVTVGPRPGTYPIGVRVRDARGRLATAEQRIEFVGDGRR